MKNQRGEATIILIAVLAVVAAIALPKPKFFDSRSREADRSADSSAAVEQAVAKALVAEQAKGAAVSASINQIGVAASQLPDSPQAAFISRETSFITPLLPAPNPIKLLEAERRRVAILEGKLELADKLYARGTKDNVALLERAVRAEAKADLAMTQRRAVDGQLAESAAYARGQEMVIGILSALLVLVGVLWALAKFNSIGPSTLGKMIADIRWGDTADMVFDRYIPERLHRKVRHAASDASP